MYLCVSVVESSWVHLCDGTQCYSNTNLRRQLTILSRGAVANNSHGPAYTHYWGSWGWALHKGCGRSSPGALLSGLIPVSSFCPELILPWQKTRPIWDTAFSDPANWLLKKRTSNVVVILSSIRYLSFFAVCWETWLLGVYVLILFSRAVLCMVLSVNQIHLRIQFGFP